MAHQYEYTEIKMKYERQFYDLLFKIKKCPGVIIGSKSLEKLFFFMGGYDYAFSDLMPYRLHFDKDFQEYVSNKFPTKMTWHWNTVIAQNRTDEEAFDFFYELLDEFIVDREKLLND